MQMRCSLPEHCQRNASALGILVEMLKDGRPTADKFAINVLALPDHGLYPNCVGHGAVSGGRFCRFR